VSPSPTSDNREPRLLRTLSSDLQEVSTDLGRHGVDTITSTFEDIETFYLTEAARRRLASVGRIRRFFLRGFWLIRGLLMKLPPARRVMLAFAFLLLMPGIHVNGPNGFSVDFQAPLVSVLIVVVILMLELKDKLIARNELVAGRAVQLALMPPESPVVPGWDVWLHTEPANDVGGDLVDHLQLDEDQHGIALGDVAGKALPAALLMVKLQSTLRALVPKHDTLASLGADVNRILHRDGLPNRFATLVYLIVSSSHGRVRYLNAGHLPPIVMRGPSVEDLPGGSIALGFIGEATFSEREVELNDGDVLVVVSDGVVEAINKSEEFFGEERLRVTLRRVAGQPAVAIGKAVLEALREFLGPTRPHDDVSVIVVKRQMRSGPLNL
jgi:hypothetical protein